MLKECNIFYCSLLVFSNGNEFGKKLTMYFLIRFFGWIMKYWLLCIYIYIFLKTQYTNILFNQVPWNSSLEKVKLHCVKVIGPDSTSNSFMSTSGSRVQMWLFHTRHLADVYGSFTDQEMGRQLAGKSRLLLSFSFWYYYVHVTNTWCFEITCIFWIYRRFKFPVKKSFQLVKVFLQDEY